MVFVPYIQACSNISQPQHVPCLASLLWCYSWQFCPCTTHMPRLLAVEGFLAILHCVSCLFQLNHNRPSGSKPIWQDHLHKKFVTDITPLTSRHSAQGIAGDTVCNRDLLQIFCKTKAANVCTFMQREKAWGKVILTP